MLTLDITRPRWHTLCTVQHKKIHLSCNLREFSKGRPSARKMMPLGEHQFIYLNFEWRTDATELAGAPFFKNLANTLTPSRLVWFTLRAVFFARHPS